MILLISLVSFAARIALCQSNAVDGAVDGYVHSASGDALNAAQVTLLNVNTNISQKTATDDQGYYRFPLVQVGTYQLSVTAPGFDTYLQNGIVLTVGQTARVDATMRIGAVSETVAVVAESPMMETSSAVVGSVLGRKEVSDLPIPSRNLFNFQLLSPGVIGLPSSAFGTTQFTFGGAERSQWNLDGLDNSQKEYNRQIRLMIVTPEAVEETQTLSSGYSAEFGRAAGGQVNVILKSGTNDVHGSALYQYRPYDLQAIPTLASVNPPSRSWQDGAFTLGGPIKKDKIFYFLQYELNPYTLPTPITISASNAAALGLPASQTGYSPFGETYQSLMGKFTYTLGAKNTGYFRFNQFTNHQPVTAGGLTITNAGTNFSDHMNGGGAQLATAFSSNLLNELRFGISQRDTANSPAALNQPGGALINITGVAEIGYNPLSKQRTTERSVDGIDNVTYTHGRSTWKFGTEIENTFFNRVAPINRTFTFGGLAADNGRPAINPLNQYLKTVSGAIDPATGRPYTYTYFNEDGGNPKLTTSFNFLNFFAQDELRLTPRLLLNAGIRYEAILFPGFDPQAPDPQSRKVNNDYSDVAPRIALTYSPGDRQKTVVRAAYGLYYDIPGLSTFYSAAQTNGVTFLSYQVAGAAAGAPVFPNILDIANPSFAVKPNINAFDPNFHNAYQIQANLQVERELTSDILVTLGYLFAGMRHGVYTAEINLGAPTGALADGRPVFGGPRPNTQFNQINVVHSGASTNFNGLFVNLTRRLNRGVEFGVNYTFSHALANNIGEGGAGEDPTNLNRDYGNADDDARHNLVLQGILEPQINEDKFKWINGFEFTSTYFYNSGFPINEVSGTDLNKDGILNDRPLFVARNSFRGPGLSEVDAQLMRNFNFVERYHLSVFGAAENLMNSSNANCNTASGCTGAVVHTAGASDFGRVISARTSRNVQVGLKFNF
ncbi:MAG TPA: TonB-dependent receptor [Acidobacteriaceae bacterium]|nr:TonB-dependent receptor [Acidobacteriaceae bacterium]